MNRARTWLLLAAAACILPLAVLGIALAAIMSGSLNPPSASGLGACLSGATVSSSPGAAQLSAAQVSDARTIYDVSVSLQLPVRAPVIAIATSMQESRLLDLGFGDADSLGLFQQRPSMGWGSPAEIMQPVYAAQKFYSALVAVPGWESLPLTVAAQDVQHSAYPGAYAQWQTLAESLVTQFSGRASNCAADNGRGGTAAGLRRLPRGFTLPPGTPQAVVTAIGYAAEQLGRPYVWGATGPGGFDCSGLVMMAYRAAGIQLPRTTFQQVTVGTPVYSLAQLEPGDLVFAAGSDGTPTDPGHVGLYIGTFHGNGLVLEAPRSGENVMITPLSTYWQQNTAAIRRIVLNRIFNRMQSIDSRVTIQPHTATTAARTTQFSRRHARHLTAPSTPAWQYGNSAKDVNHVSERQLRRRCRSLLRDLDIRPPLNVSQLCDRLGEHRGKPIKLRAYPLPVPGPFGIWLSLPKADHIVYQAETTRAHQDHIIIHELGHLIAGHRSDEGDEEFLHSVFPEVDPTLVRHMLRRTVYDTDEEREAETVATIILEWASVLDSLAPRLSTSGAGRHMQDALGDRVGWL